MEKDKKEHKINKDIIFLRDSFLFLTLN